MSPGAEMDRTPPPSRSAPSLSTRVVLASAAVATLVGTAFLTFSDRVPFRLQVWLWQHRVPDWVSANSVMKLGHFVIWGLIAAMVGAAAPSRRAAIAGACIVAGVSLVAEALQDEVTRDRVTNLGDAATNLCGIALGIPIVIAVRQRLSTI